MNALRARFVLEVAVIEAGPFEAAAEALLRVADAGARRAVLERLVGLLRAVAPPAALVERASATAPQVGWRATALLSIEDRVELSLFALRRGQEIPLHDHPGMHGLLRVVRGRARLEPWDWEVGERPPPGGVAPATPGPPALLEPGDLALTTPERAQLHRLVAEEDVVLLDLFAPPYGPARRCAYYRVERASAGWRLRRL